MATALVETPTRHFLEASISAIPSTSSLAPGPPLLSRLPAVLLASPLQAPHAVAYSVPLSSSLVGYTQSHLPSIDDASLALHHALYSFRATGHDYATRPYEQAFNWDNISLPDNIEREWYIVAFRSTRRKDANTDQLYQADREAHEEAVTAGGLLLYWYGAVNEKGENLATCIWQSRKHAVAAMHNPKHAIAARLAGVTYERYVLERYVLRKERDSSQLQILPWTGGDVGF